VKEEVPVKMSGEQLALATGTQLGLADDVRAAIAEALKGKAPTAKVHAAERKFTLVQVLPDRSLGQRFPLTEQSVVVGREKAPIAFADDPLMSRQHAVFTSIGGALYVEDLDSANGVFVRIRRPIEIEHADIVLLGRQMFRFQLLGKALPGEEEEEKKKKAKKTGRETVVAKFEPKDVVKATGTIPAPGDAPLQGELVRLVRGGVEEKHFPLYRGENSFGRTKGNYTFADDPYLSRTHARLILHSPRCVLEDLNSTNGTFVRIRERQILDVDDTVLVGSQFLRVLADPA
jgi:pSer/pThr/pTyr-binding forkhead associated (FHA) protein